MEICLSQRTLVKLFFPLVAKKWEILGAGVLVSNAVHKNGAG
jgi:hypothetical protein